MRDDGFNRSGCHFSSNLPSASAEMTTTGPEPAPAAEKAPEPISTLELIEQLSADRIWLLQQIDGGRWSDLRLDLAALERELGQMLDLASERFAKR